jgi:hypothetical protein
MANLYGVLERVIADSNGVDALLFCHKVSSTRVEPSVKQAARLATLAIGGAADFGASTLCFTLMDTANVKQVANMPTFVDVPCKKLGTSDSLMNHVCTLVNPEGKPDVDALLLKLFDSLVSDRKR